MASEIVLKENELTDIAQRAIALDASMSNINTKLQKLYSQLDADIVMIQNAGAHITYGLPEISKNIKKQSEDMTNISRIMSTAGEKAVTTNRTIIGEVEGVKAMSLSMGSVVAATSVSATLGAITSKLFGGNTVTNSVMPSWVNEVCGIVKGKADEAGEAIGTVLEPVVDTVEGAINKLSDAIIKKKLEQILDSYPEARVYSSELLAKGYTEEAIYNLIKDNPADAENILKWQCYNDTINYINQRDQKFISSKAEWERVGKTTNAYGPYNADGTANCRAVTLLKIRELGVNTNGRGWGAQNALRNNGFSVDKSNSLSSVIEKARIPGVASSVHNIVVVWKGHAMLIDEVRFDRNGEAFVFMSDNDNYSDALNVGKGYSSGKAATNKNPWPLSDFLSRYNSEHPNETFDYCVMGTQQEINAVLGK